jgi:hypothetical protein
MMIEFVLNTFIPCFETSVKRWLIDDVARVDADQLIGIGRSQWPPNIDKINISLVGRSQWPPSIDKIYISC